MNNVSKSEREGERTMEAKKTAYVLRLLKPDKSE